MYRQWAQFKLTASIYRYHIMGGAATYFIAPQFAQFREYNNLYFKKIFAEKEQMKKAGLLNY